MIDKKQNKSGLLRFAIRFLAICCGIGLVIVATSVALVHHFEQDLPSTQQIKSGNYHPPQVTRVLARDGSILAELFTERRTIVPIESLPVHVKLAMIAAEDAHFFEHEGLNYLGMLRALLVNVRAGKTRQGASTITQQVVKNTLLDSERTYKRKIREALLARRIEQQLSKDQILELYVNQIYFGHGRYGIQEAARYYFGCDAKDLSLSQAALLAGIVASPERFSPRKNPEKAQQRKQFVLNQMHIKKIITAEQYQTALTQSTALTTVQSDPAQLAPEIVEIAKRTLKHVAGEGATLGGYTITTTIDPKLQQLARQSVRDNLQAYDKRHGLRGPLSPPKLSSAKSKKATSDNSRNAPTDQRPRFEDYKTLVGEVTGADDTQRLLFVRVGPLHGVVRLDDHVRYNPQNLAPSAFAPKGTLLRVSLLAKEPEPTADSAHATTESRPVTTVERKDPAKVATSAPQKSHIAGETTVQPNTTASSAVPLRLELGPQSALVALDVRTRHVLALVGNYEGIPGGLDRCTQARRQPGSTFKPIVYSYALHSRRFTPSTLVETRSGSVRGLSGRDEGDMEAVAPVRLRQGLAKSVNVVAVHVAKKVGPANVVAWAKSLGISTHLGPDLSLALGAYEVIPVELANAYACFADAGIYNPPVFITRIQDSYGRDLPLPAQPPARRVMESNEAYLITSMMKSVVEEGTGARAKSLARPLAGKTGTTNDAKDAWFVGFSTDMVVAVWTGYDDASPLGAREAGATAALPAWIQFMKGALASKPATDFARPPDIVSARIDPTSGLLATADQQDAIVEYYLPGTEPTEVAARKTDADFQQQREVDTPITPTTTPSDASEQTITEVPSQSRDAAPLPALPPADNQILLF